MSVNSDSASISLGSANE